MEIKRYKAKNPLHLDDFRDIHFPMSRSSSYEIYRGINRIGLDTISQTDGVAFILGFLDVEGELRIGMRGGHTVMELVGRLDNKPFEDSLCTSLTNWEDFYFLIGFLINPNDRVYAYQTRIQRFGLTDSILTFARRHPSEELYDEVNSLPVNPQLLSQLEKHVSH